MAHPTVEHFVPSDALDDAGAGQDNTELRAPALHQLTQVEEHFRPRMLCFIDDEDADLLREEQLQELQ